MREEDFITLYFIEKLEVSFSKNFEVYEAFAAACIGLLIFRVVKVVGFC